MPGIKVVLDPDTILDEMNVEEYLGLQDRDMRAIIGIFSKFVIDEESGERLPPDKGKETILKLSMRQLGELADTLNEGIEGGVPKANAVD